MILANVYFMLQIPSRPYKNKNMWDIIQVPLGLLTVCISLPYVVLQIT